MKRFLKCTFFILPLLMVGCNKSDQNENVVSKRYIHKYGYDVSKNDWDLAEFPGQVVTTLRNGTTITASYEDGVLHGQTTHTYPHSQTIESLLTYEKGQLVKKQSFNIRGIPEKEETYLSPTHLKEVKWYSSGVPMSVEEYHITELLNGEYYNINNEILCKVTKGFGERLVRDQHEKISAKETFEHGYAIKKETFHPHGIPHTIISLSGGKMHGEKKVFAATGEPISTEFYANNLLDGLATYYQNGCRFLEINYKEGKKHGSECHFIDGETLVEKTEWLENQKHGPSTVYFDGMSKSQWYFNNILVTKEKYRELCLQTENIAIMSERARRG